MCVPHGPEAATGSTMIVDPEINTVRGITQLVNMSIDTKSSITANVLRIFISK